MGESARKVEVCNVADFAQYKEYAKRCLDGVQTELDQHKAANKEDVSTLTASLSEYKESAGKSMDALKSYFDASNTARQQELETMKSSFSEYRASSRNEFDSAIEAQKEAFEDYKMEAQDQFDDLKAELVFRLRKSGHLNMQFARGKSGSDAPSQADS